MYQVKFGHTIHASAPFSSCQDRDLIEGGSAVTYRVRACLMTPHGMSCMEWTVQWAESFRGTKRSRLASSVAMSEHGCNSRLELRAVVHQGYRVEDAIRLSFACPLRGWISAGYRILACPPSCIVRRWGYCLSSIVGRVRVTLNQPAQTLLFPSRRCRRTTRSTVR